MNRKAKDIAKQYGIDKGAFEYWLEKSGAPFASNGIRGWTIDEGQNIDAIVQQFQSWNADAQAQLAEQQAAQEQAAREKQAAMARILITSGFTFDGYTITRYSGYISGDDLVEINRYSLASTLTDALVHIRRNALAELKEAAYDLGCNAVIGVDFDYMSWEPESVNSSGGTLYLPYVVCVTANGNAVIIEKS